MSIFAGDAILKTVVDLIIDDIRKNPWLVDDIFSDLVSNKWLKDKHGQKEIEQVKEWLKKNDIKSYMKLRLSNVEYPNVTISLGNSLDSEDLHTLADQTVEIETLQPDDIGKPIPYIHKPFDIDSYDDVTKVVTFPVDITTEDVGVGMLILDPATGNAYSIVEIVGANEVRIGSGQSLTGITNVGVIPQYLIYKARRESRHFWNEYTITCSAHGEPVYAIWLWAIVLYGLMRYNEVLLEGNCMQLASFRSTDLLKDETGADNVYQRHIIVKGLVENTWIKTPTRIIEVAKLKDSDNETVPAGLKILANVPDQVADECSTWTTIEDDEE